MAPNRRTSARGGFTLIELLAVILIVGVLAGVLISQLAGAEESANMSHTRVTMTQLSGIIEAWERDSDLGGDYPPSSFTAAQGVDNSGYNIGAEALYVALSQNDWAAANAGTLIEDNLGNVDGDSSPGTLIEGGSRKLYEVVDAWKNPIAYIHRRDYTIDDRMYLTESPDTGEQIESVPVAFKNADGVYFRKVSFQLISAGRDGEFGTEDDITTFDRNR